MSHNPKIPLSTDFIVPTNAQIGATSRMDGGVSTSFGSTHQTNLYDLCFPRKQLYIPVRQLAWASFQFFVPARSGRVKRMGNTVGFISVGYFLACLFHLLEHPYTSIIFLSLSHTFNFSQKGGDRPLFSSSRSSLDKMLRRSERPARGTHR